MNKVGIIQSNYLPWKGYFDIINEVDIFVLYDDVKYTRRDWRNRNRIKGINGAFWITVPVHKNSNTRRIDQVEIVDSSWQRKHLISFQKNYSKAKFYRDYIDFINHIYSDREWKSLSELNHFSIKEICKLLGIKTKFVLSSDYELKGEKTDRLISLLKQVDADYYLTGPKAKEYIEEQKFVDAGIELRYKDYSGYPEYNQLWGKFDHAVSIIDMLFNCGEKSPYYIWGWRDSLKDQSS